MDWLDELKKMKASSGLTTKDIAVGSRIPEPTLEKLFSGATKDPKLNTMKQLVHYLGYTLDDLAPTKEKSPIPGKPGIEDSETERIALFYQQLVAAGYLREEEAFTDSQAQIISAVLGILDATFTRKVPVDSDKSRKTG